MRAAVVGDVTGRHITAGSAVGETRSSRAAAAARALAFETDAAFFGHVACNADVADTAVAS